MPRYSVIIPVYNRERMIERAVRSVLMQTYDDFEVIVVDDGSTDRSAAVVESIADSRVRLVPMSRNCGVSAARNEGVRQARGELIAFLDSDDEYLPEKLATVDALAKVKTSEVGVFFTNMIQVDNHAGGERQVLRTQKLFRSDDESAYHYFLRVRPAGFGLGPVFRREALDAAGEFDGTLTSIEDKDLLLRVFREGYEYEVISDILHRKHNHDGVTVTGTARGKKAPLYEVLYAKHQDVLDAYPRLDAAACNKIGVLYLEGGNPKKAAHFFLRGAKRQPFNVKLWTRWLLAAPYALR